MAKKSAKKSKAPVRKGGAKAKTPIEPAAPVRIAATIAAVARHFEVHERTVKSWFAKGCPHDRGAYDLDAIAKWRDANIAPADEDASGERGMWETRRSRAAALKAELELQVAQGRLVEVELAARVLGRHVAEVRAHLEQIPAFAASLVKLTAAQKRTFMEAVAKKVRRLCEGFEKSLDEMSKAAAGKEEESE